MCLDLVIPGIVRDADGYWGEENILECTGFERVGCITVAVPAQPRLAQGLGDRP